jgi:hypothetical protein
VPQRHDRKETDDANGDEGGFSETSCDVSKSEDFVLPLEDREQHDSEPILAMMRMSSQTAPKRTRVSAPAPTTPHRLRRRGFRAIRQHR